MGPGPSAASFLRGRQHEGEEAKAHAPLSSREIGKKKYKVDVGQIVFDNCFHQPHRAVLRETLLFRCLQPLLAIPWVIHAKPFSGIYPTMDKP